MASQEPSTTMSINKMLQSDEKSRQADDPTKRVAKGKPSYIMPVWALFQILISPSLFHFFF
jgi:hypothetical protein